MHKKEHTPTAVCVAGMYWTQQNHRYGWERLQCKTETRRAKAELWGMESWGKQSDRSRGEQMEKQKQAFKKESRRLWQHTVVTSKLTDHRNTPASYGDETAGSKDTMSGYLVWHLEGQASMLQTPTGSLCMLPSPSKLHTQDSMFYVSQVSYPGKNSQLLREGRHSRRMTKSPRPSLKPSALDLSGQSSRRLPAAGGPPGSEENHGTLAANLPFGHKLGHLVEGACDAERSKAPDDSKNRTDDVSGGRRICPSNSL